MIPLKRVEPAVTFGIRVDQQDTSWYDEKMDAENDASFWDRIDTMHKTHTWRDLLKEITSDTQKKRRLLESLNITPVTLNRWIHGESEPRTHHVQQLVNTFPEYRYQLQELLEKEKNIKNKIITPKDNLIKTIPPEFYQRILLTRASTKESLRFWTTSRLILQQALGQLDPERRGLSIWIVRCMPPSGPYQKVRSLRECVGIGNPPWPGILDEEAMFLGTESLSGNVVTLCRPGIIQNLDEEPTLTPFIRDAFEKSAAIYPILYAGYTAGVFMVSSTEINYFLTQSRTKLVEQYADLAALAFDPEDFYPPEQIALGVMPNREEQRVHFSRFHQMVAHTMQEAASCHEPLTNEQADMIIWQQLEDILLKLAEQKV